MNVEYIEHKNH